MVPSVAGRCDPRFAPVREAFATNVAERGEVGAGVCVTLDGSVVVDLWGGSIDAGGRIPWGPDTLVNVFSIGKAMAATCVALLAGRGQLDLDAPVTVLWPEFGCHGKQDVTLRVLLSHRAGLPAVRRRLPPGAMLDRRIMVDALGAERPWWEPGTAHGYHVNTFGFLVDEVVRRAVGRSLRTILREEVAGPLGADVAIGVPPGAEGRVAECIWALDPPSDEEPSGLEGDELMRFNAYFNPSGLSGAGVVNTSAWRYAEIPSTNAHASARGVARVYAALAAGGRVDGVRVADAEVLAEMTREHAAGTDRVLQRPSRFGLGFQLTQPERPLGPNPGAFGHFGAGGSVGFCDPEARIGFGYVRNTVDQGWQNPCNRALIDALFTSLG